MSNLQQSVSLNKQIKAEIARRHFLDFVIFTSKEYDVNWHHRVLANKLEDFAKGKIKKLMVFMPPQHGKSEQTSRKLPAYILGLRPSAKIVGCSYSADIAQGFNRNVQTIISSDEYALVFPETYLNDKNVRTTSHQSYLRNADMFETVKHRGFYKSVGVGGSLTSTSCDVLIIDDPVKDAVEAQSATDQLRKWEWYISVALTRLHANSQQLIVMTRWHENDLCGKILSTMPDGWEILHLEAIKKNINHKDDPRNFGDALWEARHSKKDILAIAAADPRTFDALYQGDPKPNENTIYCTGFNYAKNVKKISQKKGLPLHYTVDFNSSPYMTGLVINLEWKEGNFWNGHDSYFELTVFDKLALTSPHNNAQSLGAFFESQYPEIQEDGYFQYGDASGNSSTGVSSSNEEIVTATLFSDLISGLSPNAKKGVIKRIPKSNPKYRSIGRGMMGRRVFVNKVFSGQVPVRVLIDPSCTELIKDLENCTVDANGKLAKPKDKHGVEMYGHMLQALEYFICHPETLGYLAKI